MVAVDASFDAPQDVVTDATQYADGGYPILSRFAGKRVLHCGDSFVGGAGGLTRALEPRFKGSSAKFMHDSQTSLFMHEVAQGDYLTKLLARTNPDVVVLTLGANDVFMPHPEYLIPHIEGTVRKLRGKECYWVAPPLWKADTGVLKTISEHVAPCRYYDVLADRTDLKIPRRNDGIHPTDEGGELWASAFWEFLATQPAPEPPAPKTKDGGGDMDAATEAATGRR
jgi:acyl-CoA thioesterase-1